MERTGRLGHRSTDPSADFLESGSVRCLRVWRVLDLSADQLIVCSDGVDFFPSRSTRLAVRVLVVRALTQMTALD